MRKTVLVAGVCALVAVGTAVAGPRGGKRGPGPDWAENVTRTVTPTENGVLIEISSDDPAVVERIQARHAERADRPQRPSLRAEDVEHAVTVTNIENGVAIDITSDDPAAVELIQAHFAKKGDRGSDRPGAGGKHGRHRGDKAPMQIEGAERTVTNTETGVLIEISSDDPAVVEEIQARFANVGDQGRALGAAKQAGQRGQGKCQGQPGKTAKAGGRPGHGGFGLMRPIEGAERTVTNLDNGVRVEITSDDPEVVQKVQERLAKFPPGPWCPRGQRNPAAVPGEGDAAPQPDAQE